MFASTVLFPILAALVAAGPTPPDAGLSLHARQIACRSDDYDCRVPCGGIRGLPCPDGLRCVDDPSDDCNPAKGGSDCIGICVEPQRCGGLLGLRCPKGLKCIDDPSDECDPKKGGFDCIGICV